MNNKDRILDAAERRMRTRGYNAVSYRDIAADVGMKSASLHYHYPKKCDLGAALVKRYSDNFQMALETETKGLTSPSEKVDVFVDIHRRSFKEHGLVCLCAVFGGESLGLPVQVREGVRTFFQRNIIWLSQQYRDMGTPQPLARAKAGVSALEGALIISVVNKDNSVFEGVVETLFANP